MDDIINPGVIERYYQATEAWILANVVTYATLLQVVVVIVALGVAWLLTRPVRRLLAHLLEKRRLGRPLRAVITLLESLALVVLWLVFQWLSVLIAVEAGWPHHLIQIIVSLLTAWIVIRLTSKLVRDPAWSKFIAIVAWTIAALNILGLLDDTVEALDHLAITLGDLRISVLTVVEAFFALAVLLWLAMTLSRLLERRITASPNLTPSVQVLLTKLLKASLIVVAIVASLSVVGIDLTAFALFTGALGVGIGFGLQKIIANLISGVILLLDKSIKPGDVIGVAGTYGQIRSLGARYASVITRDGIEHLIPNEELITTPVENWSYTDQNVRLRIPIGVSYNSDVREAIEQCLAAATGVERVLADPKPVCLLKGFGDSSVDLELRIWIRDPHKGVANIKSVVMLRVWDNFQANGIEIPFPQRDLHIKDPDKLAAALSTSSP